MPQATGPATRFALLRYCTVLVRRGRRPRTALARSVCMLPADGGAGQWYFQITAATWAAMQLELAGRLVSSLCRPLVTGSCMAPSTV